MHNILKKAGLDDSEAKMYEALIELGPSTVTQITKKAGITRTLGYHVLDRLAIDGLVDEVARKGAVMRYAAKHPQALLQFTKNRRNQWERNLKAVEDHLPDLLKSYNLAESPGVRYQFGIEGLKSIYWETLQAKSEILSILGIEGWNVPELRRWGKEYNAERSRCRVHERVLLVDTPAGREWMRGYRGSFTYTKYRLISKEKLGNLADFGGEINVYDNKVMIALLKEPHRMGIIIEHTVLADMISALFELAWEQGEAEQPAVAGR